MGRKGLYVMGGTLDLHGAPVESWLPLGATADAGATSLTVAGPVAWQPQRTRAAPMRFFDNGRYHLSHITRFTRNCIP